MKEKKKKIRTLLGELEEIEGGDGVFRVATQDIEGMFWPETTDEGRQVFRLELKFSAEGIFDLDALKQLLFSWCWLWGDVSENLRDEIIETLTMVTPSSEKIVEQRQSRKKDGVNSRTPKLVV